MRILFLGNNWVGWQVLKYLKEQEEKVVGLVIHPQGKRKFGEEIISTANVNGNQIIAGQTLRQPAVLEAIKALRPDIGLSILFDYVLRSEFLKLFGYNFDKNQGSVFIIFDQSQKGVGYLIDGYFRVSIQADHNTGLI